MKPELLKELIEYTALEDIPVKYRNIAEITGVKQYLNLCSYAVGDEIYFPKLESMLIPARNRKIRDEYDGWNVKQLAEKYDLTAQQIRAILKGIPTPEQIDLFTYGAEANIDIK